MTLNAFTKAQVAEHNSSKSLWVIIHGKVYDLTKFFQTHPGGEEVLLGAAGTDATVDYDKADHSMDAKDYMTDYLIGKISEDK